MKTRIKNGNIVLEDACLAADIIIENGLIAEINPPQNVVADIEIDATGCVVLPGFIDPHTHMSLQQSEKFRAADDFYSGTIAAALGGTTTIIDHIAFSPVGSPLMTSINTYHQLAADAVIDYGFHGVIQRVDDDIIEELKDIIKNKGVSSFKAYSTYGFPVNDQDLLRLLAAIKEADGVLTVHCENDGITRYYNDMFAKEGKTEPRYYPQSRPNIAEAETVGRLIDWAHHVGDAPAYVVHTSARQSLERVRQARRRGQKNVYVETCTQYLMLDESLYQADQAQAARYIMAPPLRSKADQTALWQALLDGTIQTVGTDHCPFMLTEKRLGSADYRKAPGGIAGVQERGLVMYSEAVVKRDMPLVDFAKVMSTNAAKIFKCYPQKGVIKIGSDADLVILNPNRQCRLSADVLHSNCDYSPYQDYHAAACIEKVFSKGELIVEGNRFVGNKGDGQFLKR